VELAIAAQEVKEWLEWAGAKLLAFPTSSPAPRGYRVAWPEFAADARQAYGYTRETLRAGAPSAREIALMDELLALPGLISDPNMRRIVHCRALVTPVLGRYIYSYTKIALVLHSNGRRIAVLHQRGLGEIARKLPREQGEALRKSLR
jgi:Domain of unknown function (DUF6362)